MNQEEKFTIAGVGRGSKGQLVVNGISIKSGRKCKAVRPAVFKVYATIGGDGSIKTDLRCGYVQTQEEPFYLKD